MVYILHIVKFLQELYCYMFWGRRKLDNTANEFGGFDVEGRIPCMSRVASPNDKFDSWAASQSDRR